MIAFTYIILITHYSTISHLLLLDYPRNTYEEYLTLSNVPRSFLLKYLVFIHSFHLSNEGQV